MQMSAEDIDYLDDPLLQSPEETPKAARTPLLERAAEVLAKINAFLAETGTEPISAKGKSVRERLLANKLACLRASRADRTGLEHADIHGLSLAVRSEAIRWMIPCSPMSAIFSRFAIH